LEWPSMSSSTIQLPEDQLIELLLQLRKTSPDQAKAILNSQPQITYALVALMVKMGVIDIPIFQVSCIFPHRRPVSDSSTEANIGYLCASAKWDATTIDTRDPSSPTAPKFA
jgi:hypothetical protein